MQGEPVPTARRDVRRGFDPGPHPGAPDRAAARRLSRVKKRDNGPEIAVRTLLHARGRRYRVAWRVPGQPRRTIDIAFPGRRLAVYIDGCFWHGCPAHEHRPKTNALWWERKILLNGARDADVTRHLESLGWTVMRFWEHEPPADVVDRIERWLDADAPLSRRR